MHVEAVAAAGAGRVALHRRMAVGHVDDAGQVAADQRLERGAQLGEIVGKLAIEDRLRLRHGRELAALIEQRALDAGADDDVGDEAGELDVVGADREQHEVELAARAMCLRALLERVLQLLDLRRHRAGAAAGRRAFAGALRAEQAALDRRAGAGERQEGDGRPLVLDRERERGAQLVAVQRAVAGRRHPARAVAVPVVGRGGRSRWCCRRRPCRPRSRAGSAGNIRRAPSRESAGSRSPRRPARSAGRDCLRRRRRSRPVPRSGDRGPRSRSRRSRRCCPAA